MPVWDLNDYLHSTSGPPGSVTTTCMRCGITEPHTGVVGGRKAPPPS